MLWRYIIVVLISCTDLQLGVAQRSSTCAHAHSNRFSVRYRSVYMYIPGQVVSRPRTRAENSQYVEKIVKPDPRYSPALLGLSASDRSWSNYWLLIKLLMIIVLGMTSFPSIHRMLPPPQTPHCHSDCFVRGAWVGYAVREICRVYGGRYAQFARNVF